MQKGPHALEQRSVHEIPVSVAAVWAVDVECVEERSDGVAAGMALRAALDASVHVQFAV